MSYANIMPYIKSPRVIKTINAATHIVIHPSGRYLMIVVKTNKQKDITSPIITRLFKLRSRSIELLIAVARFIKAYSSDCFILFNSSTLPLKDAYNNVITETKIPMIAR